MNTIETDNQEGGQESQSLTDVLYRQKEDLLREGIATHQVRISRINRAIDSIYRNATRLCEAMAADFGNRSIHQSRMIDIDVTVGALKFARKNVRSWMRPQKRKPTFPFGLLGAKARIEYQPVGVVGCISPWNFPVQLTFGPLAGIFAAGNRVMIKPSEITPQTAALLKQMIDESFDMTEAAVFTGGANLARKFSELSFDHLLYTGSAGVARDVMRTASENLVPVTLELGGKTPVIVGTGADVEKAADKVITGKTTSAGQICLAPDYVFVRKDCKEQFIKAAKESAENMFPSIKGNPDYTSIINKNHFNRIISYIEDAKSKGAIIDTINPALEGFDEQDYNKIPPTLIYNVTDDMKIMREEVFGPVLPILEYTDIHEVIDYINYRPKPLSLYYFGRYDREQRVVLDRTTSGGVTVNDVMMHAIQEDLPFGGIGESGIGRYHGYYGFLEFSNVRSIYIQSKIVSKLAEAMKPPYS